MFRKQSRQSLCSVGLIAVLRKVIKRLKQQGKAARKRSYPSVLDKPDLTFDELKALWQVSVGHVKLAETKDNES